MLTRALMAILASALSIGCAADGRLGSVAEDFELVGPPGSGEPNLYATSDGRVLLTWFEPVDSERYALRLAVRRDAAWSEPLTVVEGDRFFVNWADFPSAVELPDGTWIVHWLEKVAEGTYAYHVKLAISKDQGRSWSEPIVPHRDDSPMEHGFVSMVPWAEAAAALVWLDGRRMKSAESRRDGDELDSGEMSVRATTITSEGELGPDVLLDSRACECCQTAIARTPKGLVAAYRDRSESEIRNIAVVRLVDGDWTEPSHIADDNWYYPGCPVNGPQLAVRGEEVAAAWFTAPEQEAAVYVAFSQDGGATFGPPIRIDDGDPLGRVDIELLADGGAIVAWLERTNDAAAVLARRVEPGGASEKSWLLANTTESRASGFPRMALAGEDLVFAWTVTGDQGGIRVGSFRMTP